MLSESEWEEIKNNLFLIYDNRKNKSPAEVEKELADLLIIKNNEEAQINRLKEVSEKYFLSHREIEVLAEIIDGRTNTEISENLSVSLSTIKKHVYNIFNKTGVGSRTQLMNLIFTKSENHD